MCSDSLSPGRWFLGGVAAGAATLVRPESPLVLVAAGLALAWRHRQEIRTRFWPLTRIAIVMAAGLLLVLLPWGIRNWISTGTFEIVSNPDVLLPWEHGSRGFGEWVDTWLVSSKQTYDFSFKFEEEPINPQDLPPSAYDSEAERQRMVALIERYNQTLKTPPNLDWEFAQLARDRVRRHPFRRYVGVPVLRAIHFWTTPRIELLPMSGEWRPPREAWRRDRVDFSVTVSFFLLNLGYMALALIGAWRYRGNPATICLALFILIRTGFITMHGTVEPRYMLVCFPALIALGAAAVIKPRDANSTAASRAAPLGPNL
jgi:4-amino-4-deoxy-L-arabinose transferase-like glycosyltransferase